MFTLQQFQTTFAPGGEGGEIKSVSKLTVNSKEENCFPNYVQEFGLRYSILSYWVFVDCSVSDTYMY